MADTLSMPTAAGLDPPRREDAVLVTPVSRHDHTAFEKIVADHHIRVAGLAYRLLGWTDEVDDVVQDVFLKALRNLPGFEGRAQLSTWLTRITVNTCRTHRRKRMLRLRFPARPVERSAEPAVSDAETCREVRAAIRALPMRGREVVVLRYFEDMPIDEIAVVLGLKRNAVEVRLNRARRRLKEMLSNRLEELGLE